MMSLLLHRRYALLLIPILWLAWGLYLYRLDAQSLWYDEGVTATIAQRPFAALTQWTARDIQPPLYYYVVAGWGRLAGWSEWSLRFVSAWWGLLTVGLLAALAMRLTGHRATGLLTALLTALHPLLLYYSQEARMYTMLVALGVLTAVLLLQARLTNHPRFWLAYLLTAATAVYTHYFAFFLLLGLGIAYLLDLLFSPPRTPTPAALGRRLLPFLLASGGILVLYGAWLATLLTQLGTDASYWQGPFKLWDALRSLAISFVVGESMLEAQAAPWVGMGALVLAAALLAFTLQDKGTPRAPARLLLYSLPWLIIPIGGVLALAAFVPKFNARYVMLALPGLLLLWSGGLARLIFPTQPAGWWRWGARAGGGLLLAVLLLTFGYADRNWLSDPAFTKAQWRELSAYVQQQRQPTEAVVLVSGHAWPIWAYYAPDLPTVRLPDLEILNVDAVLDYAESAHLLQQGLAGYTGAWLVTWQDEVVDPTGVTALHLGLAGVERPVDAQFWGLGLRHFVDLEPTALHATAPVDHQLAANFANHLRLQGYTQTANGDLLLLWQRLAPVNRAEPVFPDLQLNLRTTTIDGLPYSDPPDRRPAAYTYPAPRWPVGQGVVGRIPVAEWAGPAALPGAYQLHLGLYDPRGDPAGLDLVDAQGVALGKTVTLDLMVTAPTPMAAAMLPTVTTTLTPGVTVRTAATPVVVEPGAPLLVTLYWQAEGSLAALGPLTWQWQRVDAAQPVAGEPFARPAGLTDATAQWQRQVVRLTTPLTLAPGAYQLTLHSALDAVGPTWPVTVLPSTRRFTLPALASATATDLFLPGLATDAQVQLAGVAEALPSTLTPAAALTMTLAWQAPMAEPPPVVDYNVSIQLLGPTGLPVTQADGALPGGASTWLAGQVITQTVTLPIPSTFSPGAYRLIAVVYDPAATGARLVTAAGVDFVELASFAAD